MDILGFIIQCTQPPLSEPLLNSVFPVVVNTILASDDNSVLQVELALVLFFFRSVAKIELFLVQTILVIWFEEVTISKLTLSSIVAG